MLAQAGACQPRRMNESPPIARKPIVEQIGQKAISIASNVGRKRAERALWARGDYHAIARQMFWEVGERVVGRVGVEPGALVCDVACGTGNAALRAAAAGARVVGVDLTPELLEVGRRLAAEADLDIEWVVGDAEALPAPNASFDVVLSTFGCMFAPHHELAARELVRVLRPGGRLAVTSWTRESSIAELGQIVIAHLPTTPGPSRSPFLWGSEEHVRRLFADDEVDLQLKLETIEFRFDSAEQALTAYETNWGPFITAREMLEADGAWPEVRIELADVLKRRGRTRDAGFTYSGEYLMVVGTRKR